MRSTITCFCCICLFGHCCLSQNLDSLQKVLSGKEWDRMHNDQKARVNELIGLYYARNSARATGLQWIDKAICEAKDSTLLARCYRIKAQLLAFEEKFDETRSAALMAMKYRTKRCHVKEEILTNNVIGLVCTFTGLYEKAFEYYYRSLELAEKSNDFEGMCIVSVNLGMNYYKVCDYDMAIKYFEKSKVLCAEPDKVEHVYSNLALAYSHAGLPRTAMEHLQKILASPYQPSRADLLHVYYAQGLTFEKLGKSDFAENSYMKSLRMAKAGNNYRMVAENAVSLANIYLRTARYAMADSCLKISEALAERYHFQDISVKVFMAQAECAKALNNLHSLIAAQRNLINKNEQLYNGGLAKTLGVQKSRLWEKDYQVAMHLHSRVLRQNEMLASDHQVFTYVIILIAMLLLITSGLIIASIHIKRSHKTRLERLIKMRLEKADSSVFQMHAIIKRDSEIIGKLNRALKHVYNVM
jgi:tetratricopeptide (TPR) repeat protein